MFGATPRLRLLVFLLAGILAISVVAVVGIKKKETVDPYLHTSLRKIAVGDTLSPGFLFEIDAPAFEFVRGGTGVVREGNVLEFIVCKDLEGMVAKLPGTQIGVRKEFTPKPMHLALQRIKRNGVVEADSLPRPYPLVLPRLLSANQIDLQAPGAALPEIGWDAAAIQEAKLDFMPQKEGESFRLVKSAYERIAYVPKHDLSPEARLNAKPEDYAWYLIGNKGSLQVVDLTPGGDFMLHLIKSKDLPLIGAFTLVVLQDDPVARQIAHPVIGHVVGMARLNWFEYANSYVQACTAR
jgi:hypothetical protein